MDMFLSAVLPQQLSAPSTELSAAATAAMPTHQTPACEQMPHTNGRMQQRLQQAQLEHQKAYEDKGNLQKQLAAAEKDKANLQEKLTFKTMM